jgi:hypothetical protein
MPYADPNAIELLPTLLSGGVCSGISGAVTAGLYGLKKHNPANGFAVGGALGAVYGVIAWVARHLVFYEQPTDEFLPYVAIGLVLLLGVMGFYTWFAVRSPSPAPPESAQSDAPVVARRTFAAVPGRHKASGNKLFISYRRDDSADVTGRIYDRLVQHFGGNRVFKDVDSIPIGVDFRKYLRSLVDQCDTMLAIVGDDWLMLRDSLGRRRLDDPGDFVRIEIEAALERDMRIVPVLVEGVTMPRPEDLPESLREFAYRNGVAIRQDPDFHRDMDRLIKALGEK